MVLTFSILKMGKYLLKDIILTAKKLVNGNIFSPMA